MTPASPSGNDDFQLQRVVEFCGNAHMMLLVCALIQDQLCDRQPVSKHGNLSEISQGFPQGSILNPIMFTVYINSIHRFLSVEHIRYADDTVLYCSIPQIALNDLKLVKVAKHINFC